MLSLRLLNGRSIFAKYERTEHLYKSIQHEQICQSLLISYALKMVFKSRSTGMIFASKAGWFSCHPFILKCINMILVDMRVPYSKGKCFHPIILIFSSIVYV